jgi:hypothetical protein
MLSIPGLANIKKGGCPSQGTAEKLQLRPTVGAFKHRGPTDGALGTLRGVDERGVV